MRTACVKMNGVTAGILEELTQSKYRFSYQSDYHGAPVSLTMPLNKVVYEFNQFPPFFEGLLPEGVQLEALLRKCKLDRYDYFGQLLQVGGDLVGAVTLEKLT
ncbi:HipA N-terminal domain-containing protein [soil metagenome]